MKEEDIKVERGDSKKGPAKVGKSWLEEAQHLSSTFLANVRSGETARAIVKLIEDNKTDPAVVAFGQKHAQVMVLLNLIVDLKISDPVDRLKFVERYFQENPAYIKAIAEFSYLSQQMDRKYQIPTVAGNLAPLFQWISKVENHLSAKKEDYPELVVQFKGIATRFNEELKIMDLEKLFKEKGPDPFNSIFSRRRRDAFAQIQTCEPKQIAEFLIKHKKDHPEYMDAIFRKAKRGDRDFLKEFDAENDHASLKKLYATEGVGLKFVDKINKAYHFRMDIRLSVQECQEKLSDSAIPKTLQTALIEKMEKIQKDGFNMPTAKEMNGFLDEVKAALNSPEGLNHSAYLKILTKDKAPPSRTAMFGLDKKVFPENNKAIKVTPTRAAPLPPPRRAEAPRAVTQVKPQRH